MSTSDPITEELRKRWADCDKQARLLEAELEEITKTMDAYQRVMADRSRNHVGTSGSTGLHAHIRPSQVAHCKTQRAAWEEIARLSGGFAKPSEGVQLIVDLGLTKSNRRGAISSASNMMSNSDDWERSEVGIYRLLKNGDQEVDDVVIEGDNRWPEESCPTDSGDVSLPTYPVSRPTQDEPAVTIGSP